MPTFTTQQLTFGLFAVFCLILLESVLFENGSIVFVLFGTAFIFFALKRKKRVLFWIGVPFVAAAVMSLWSLRLLILAIVVYVLYRLWKGNGPEEIFAPFSGVFESSRGVQRNALLTIVSHSETYKWENVHMQSVYGNIVLDATNTVLPKGTSFISIRQTFGKVKIVVPHDIPCRIHIASIIGDVCALEVPKARLWNQTLSHVSGYDSVSLSQAELIISVSILFGEVEVVRG
ncbi:cell wall-active antibiotics response protein LiaF [Paenisporosarcina cavernae]|uniref:Cell wall-active antibiotics response LiaF-like C-terminal domain-containing protein n=1 Tax=Paenisporosarcina cavernae TaxID=2320858 RepID=A0A385YSK6_9BACL|nr:cell wall-active antibiotics response protein LiaF [Paenisporosarcina cavernae]AYC28658.1 hypothetical protein D3873_01765 [Paenisporosarcina cavernae]